MESVMNTAAKGREELSDAAKLMMYVWTKLCDQSKNIAQELLETLSQKLSQSTTAARPAQKAYGIP